MTWMNVKEYFPLIAQEICVNNFQRHSEVTGEISFETSCVFLCISISGRVIACSGMMLLVVDVFASIEYCTSIEHASVNVSLCAYSVKLLKVTHVSRRYLTCLTSLTITPFSVGTTRRCVASIVTHDSCFFPSLQRVISLTMDCMPTNHTGAVVK